MEEDAPAGEGQEGQPGEQQEQQEEQQQGEQAPQQEQQYEEPVAAPAVFENGAEMDAPVGEEGLEEFGDEDLGAAEGGDVDMFL
jgi:hypothetical protein